MAKLSVKQYRNVYGITDGNLWFAYTYATKERAKTTPRESVCVFGPRDHSSEYLLQGALRCK